MIRTIGLPAGKNCGIRPPHFVDYKKIADLVEQFGYPNAIKQMRVRIERTWSEILDCSLCAATSSANTLRLLMRDSSGHDCSAP